ncbi:M10 family metallopeptidase [Pukyongiella litopenaei]|uniref:Protease n=1 Tax=Pukyongiella litopenaei TaxID=2605946 RepID=A0A5C2H1L7_9RHOB|nr:M10 family metallopeptidase [Pukyongiella litopenaei]QEP30334.1 protease [Pukyongiella litopenaei]
MSGTGHTTFRVSPSGDPIIDGILWDTAWSDPAITYSTPSGRAEYGSFYGEGEQGGLFSLSSRMKATVDFALSATRGPVAAAGFSVEGFTGVNINYTSAANAHIRIAQTSRDPHNFGTAWTYLPSTGAEGGDVWLSNVLEDFSTPRAGNYAHHSLIHEIGHGLGLDHGHVSGAFGALPAARDKMEYSLMTYRAYAGDSAWSYSNETWGYAQTWMMADIAALQYLYGADFNTNSGNTVYSWVPGSGITRVNGATAINPGNNRIFATIWDGGGTDTYDLRAYTKAVSVDLNPGGHSLFSTGQRVRLKPNDADGPAKYAAGNIYNALLYQDDTRSLIENAIGGSGWDTLKGNAAANRLNGNAGNDNLYGRAGNDVLIGGAGGDHLNGGSGIDRASYSSASTGVRADLYAPSRNTGHAKGDSYVSIEDIYATARNDTLHGDGGANTIWGADGHDRIVGRAGADRLIGGNGNDKLDGGSGGDWLNGGNGYDRAVYYGAPAGLRADLQSPGTNTGHARGDRYAAIEEISGSNYGDYLLGNGGANLIWGADGHDRIVGRAGADSLSGGNGNDKLDGGSGGDWLNGGNGYDRAVYYGAPAGLRADLQSPGTNTGHARGDRYASIEEISGSNYGDRLFGDRGANTIWGADGHDLIGGRGGADWLSGGNGNDLIYGGDGNDRLSGGNGNDLVHGGSGNDHLTGGNGFDTFVFDLSSGKDTIADFRPVDTIRITGGAERLSDLNFTDTAAGLLVEFASVDIFLNGLDRADVTAANFDFF